MIEENIDRAQKTVLNRTISEFDNLKKEELVNLLVGINESSDIIRIQKDFAGNYIHPTQKPVELAKRFIRNSTEINQIVMDPFCGSGWSIIAAQDTHRKCRAIDIDPKFVSAMIERWENYTEQKATKL
jgi:DNA modification methylase